MKYKSRILTKRDSSPHLCLSLFSSLRGLDHRQDAGLDGLGQLGQLPALHRRRFRLKIHTPIGLADRHSPSLARVAAREQLAGHARPLDHVTAEPSTLERHHDFFETAGTRDNLVTHDDPKYTFWHSELVPGWMAMSPRYRAETIMV